MSEEQWLALVAKAADGLPFTWLSFTPGKSSRKEVLFSRGYVNFAAPEAVLAFRSRLDGHVLVSESGQQYRASVEYAPFQKVPGQAKAQDAKEGTIAEGAARCGGLPAWKPAALLPSPPYSRCLALPHAAAPLLLPCRPRLSRVPGSAGGG